MFAVARDPLIWGNILATTLAGRVCELLSRSHGSGAHHRNRQCGRRVIGSSRYHTTKQTAIEIGWIVFGPVTLGGVYNREMKHLMLRHAFRFVNSVVFLIGPNNIRSQRSVQKIAPISWTRINDIGRESVVYRISVSELA